MRFFAAIICKSRLFICSCSFVQPPTHVLYRSLACRIGLGQRTRPHPANGKLSLTFERLSLYQLKFVLPGLELVESLWL